MTKLSDVELLAPAGNFSCALAAFDAGADAVYCGIKKFNARERSENFSFEELGTLLEYAHKLHKKVHVTFNTLLREAELLEAAQTLAELAALSPDALIVQDPGVLRMIRNYFPSLTIHASTQMGIHNSAGMELLRRMGAKRVILERQVTLDELRLISRRRPKDLELELFVHGALCSCLSGSCLFSSWMGGWSGNRGKCKQPCRRQYFNREKPDAPGEFLFSTDDLCAIDLLQDFAALGAVSFKIEGRLRRADYVTRVVRAYRLAMNEPDRLPEAKEILKGVCERHLSHGFYSRKSMKELIGLNRTGGSGVLCGKIMDGDEGGFTVKLSSRLHVGDTVRVQTDADSNDGVSFPVLSMEKDHRKVMKAFDGDLCRILCRKQVFSPGALLFRTGETTPDLTERIRNLPPFRRSVDLVIALNQKELSVRSEFLNRTYSLSLEEAAKNPVTPETLVGEFQQSASRTLRAGTISADVQGRWFLPAGELKKLRRDFWSGLEQNFRFRPAAELFSDALMNFYLDHQETGGADVASGKKCYALSSGSHEGITAREMNDSFLSPEEEVILSPFVPEEELSSFRRKTDELYRKGHRVFRITSLFQLEILKQYPDVILKSCYPFGAANSMTLRECAELGMREVQAWLELSVQEMIQLNEKRILPVEIYCSGRPALFSTRAEVLPWKKITDVRNNEFQLKRGPVLSRLFPEEVMKTELPADFHGACFFDLRNAGEEEENSMPFNTVRGLA